MSSFHDDRRTAKRLFDKYSMFKDDPIAWTAWKMAFHLGMEHERNTAKPSVDYSFACQRSIEDEDKCEEQCDHCREYYSPLQKPNVSGELQLSELKNLLCNVSQLIQGWNATEAEWTEWDKEVQSKVHELQNKIDGLSVVNFH